MGGSGGSSGGIISLGISRIGVESADHSENGGAPRTDTIGSGETSGRSGGEGVDDVRRRRRHRADNTFLPPLFGITPNPRSLSFLCERDYSAFFTTRDLIAGHRSCTSFLPIMPLFLYLDAVH